MTEKQSLPRTSYLQFVARVWAKGIKERILATAVVLAAGGALFVPHGGASGTQLTAHSHWDDPNASYEIKACYDVLANTVDAGSEIAHIPFREQDAPNFYDLLIRTDGFQLKRRINNVAATVQPTFSTPHSFGVGSGIMFDFVAQGSTFSLYQLLGTADNPVRGPLWYQWSDSTYSRGVNISYYTVHGWDGKWDNLVATPLDNVGVGHDIHGFVQDARNVSGSGVTFDSTIPANGGVTGASQAKSGSSATWGLPSGPDYTYAITVDKAGTGHFDFRAPASNADGSGDYFTSSFYRLTLGSTPTIQRFNGSSPGQVYSASAATGGAGTYTLRLNGPAITLVSPAGKALVTVNDGGPQTGVRVRLTPGDQTWSWKGTVGGTSVPTTPTPTTTPTTPTPTGAPTTSTGGAAAGSFTAADVADAYVSSRSASGTSSALNVDGSPATESLVRFDVSSIKGTVETATLRIHSSSSQSVGYDVSTVAGSWSESSLSTSSLPSLSSKLGSSGPVSGGSWTSVTLPAAVVQSALASGSLDLGLSTTSPTNLHLDSRESSDPPQLVVTTK